MPESPGVIDKPGYTIEKLAFESLPKIFATGESLSSEEAIEIAFRLCIYVCGHAVSPAG
jgi:hypothetical protein